MKLLLDTHLLLWAAQGVEHLPLDARMVMNEPENEPFFSVASLWEIVTKCGLGREDFKVDPRVLRRGLFNYAGPGRICKKGAGDQAERATVQALKGRNTIAQGNALGCGK